MEVTADVEAEVEAEVKAQASTTGAAAAAEAAAAAATRDHVRVGHRLPSAGSVAFAYPRVPARWELFADLGPPPMASWSQHTWAKHISSVALSQTLVASVAPQTSGAAQTTVAAGIRSEKFRVKNKKVSEVGPFDATGPRIAGAVSSGGSRQR